MPAAAHQFGGKVPRRIPSHVYVSPDLELGDNAFAIIVAGDCLTPEVQEGDFLIVNPDISPRDGDLVMATREGHCMAKRFRRRNGREWFEANDIRIAITDAEVKAVVVGLYRSKL